MQFLSNANIVLNIIYLALLLTILVAGIFAFKHTMERIKRDLAKEATELQERAMNAMRAEIETMKDKIIEVEKENLLLRQTMGLIKSALRKRGLSITIDGDLVTIESANGTSHTGRIHSGSEN